jgi:hypothetical protein
MQPLPDPAQGIDAAVAVTASQIGKIDPFARVCPEQGLFAQRAVEV